MLVDIILGRRVDDDELAATVGAALSVPAAEIRVIHDLAAMAEDSSAVATLLSLPLTGEHPLLVEWLAGPKVDEIEFVRALTKMLSTDALISDDTLDPFVMLRVRADGGLERINIDSDLEDEYAVVGVIEPLPPDWLKENG